MSKHTPGPWHTQHVHPYTHIKSDKNPMIAVVRSVLTDSRQEFEANAHLIAAAPEMLEALEMMLGILTVAGIAADTEAVQHLRSVIAKAKGE